MKRGASLFTTELFEHRFLPSSRLIPRSKQKLMIVLHGKGDSLQSFADIRQELRLPGFNYLLLNAPRKFEKGYSWFATEPRHARGVKEVRKKLFLLVEELGNAGWDPQDIFWMGHSQGCLVACDLVMNYREAFGGMIGVSGYLWFFRGWRYKIARSGARRTPWLMTHGSRDRIIHPDEIREDITHLLNGDVPVLYREFPKGHDFDFTREVPFIRQWIRRPRKASSQSDIPVLVELA
ncbi:MAG TPA: alpha/beta hydrolase [Bdellovibrionales bacterium]|nr:alpha/beta hydrolase [Bdellovibrionales bacterium]